MAGLKARRVDPSKGGDVPGVKGLKSRRMGRVEGWKDLRSKDGRAEGWKGSRFEGSKDGVDGMRERRTAGREDGWKVCRKGVEGRDGRQKGETGGKEAKIGRLERVTARTGKAKAGRQAGSTKKNEHIRSHQGSSREGSILYVQQSASYRITTSENARAQVPHLPPDWNGWKSLAVWCCTHSIQWV